MLGIAAERDCEISHISRIKADLGRTSSAAVPWSWDKARSLDNADTASETCAISGLFIQDE